MEVRMLNELILSVASCSGLPSWACDAQLQTGIDPALIYSICHVESTGRVAAYTPHDGDGTPSYGVCQIKMNTARHMGFKGTEAELLQASTNAKYAAKYVIWQYKRYNDLLKAISAYNVGHSSSNDRYVNKVMTLYTQIKGVVNE